ncbi:MAG TPA: efflux RND transporter periplasmic adaptor subunit [Pyrinomonadaceae bacterium]|jgi:multidrug efflux pump subunit AcrA (membrane-fusion protein)|nr:efflux RND transporter periplasmic adaptor subunit [Pyrinomonadaceae bacterium]
MKEREATNPDPVEPDLVDDPVGDEAHAEKIVVRRTSSGWSRLTGRQRFIILAIALLVVALAAFWWWRSRKAPAAAEAAATPVVSVRVAKAERQQIAAQVSALGTIFPREQATVAAKVSAQIRQMPLLKNRVVRAGEVIATLESRDLQAQRDEAVAALNEALANARSLTTGTIPQTNAQDEKALRDARANVSNARNTYERRLALYNQGGISKKDLEASQLALTTAENDLRLAEQTISLRAKALNPNDRALAAARVQQAQQHVATLDAQLSYATVRAPLTGIVTEQFQFEGEFASAGGKLVNIADISEVTVKAPFADTVAAELKIGDAAMVLPTDTPGEQMTGQISLVSRASDPTNRTVEVWVTLGNGAGRLHANGAAQVIVNTKESGDAIVVPAPAVTLDASNANEGTLMVVDAASIAHETKVTVGIRTSDKVEITSGLQGGETVVIEGNYALPDETKVEVSEDKAEPAAAGDEKKGNEP